MNKGLIILGLIALIIGVLPILLQLTGYGPYAAFWSFHLYEVIIGGILITDIMLILIAVGVISLILGAVK
jgi:hypothetical protein